MSKFNDFKKWQSVVRAKTDAENRKQFTAILTEILNDPDGRALSENDVAERGLTLAYADYCTTALRAEIDALKSAPWYLIYEGSSEDGMGRGKYMCRTLDLSFAIKHLKENDSPYFTGHVDVVSSERPIARFRPSQLDDLKRFVESMS